MKEMTKYIVSEIHAIDKMLQEGKKLAEIVFQLNLIAP